MPIKIKLTKSNIEALAAPAAGQVLVWDTDLVGFGLRITSGNVRSFILQRRINGRDRRMKLGRFGDITCDEARLLAKKDIGKIADGKDPIAEREAKADTERAKRRAIDLREHYTVRSLLSHYCKYLENAGKVSAADVKRTITLNVFSHGIASMAAAEATPKQWAELLRTIGQSGRKRTAGVLRSYVRAAYSLAMRAELSPTAPAEMIGFGLTSNPIDPIDAGGGGAGKRERTLSIEELRAYITALSNASDIGSHALLLALVTGGQRPKQLLRVQMNDVDIRAGTILLFDPKGRRAQPRPHLVPLGEHGLDLVRRLSGRAESLGGPYLFNMPGGKQMSFDTMANRFATIRLGMEKANQLPAGPFQLKDVRRTCETMLAGLGISKDIRAQLLSHGISGVQSQRYDMHDYLAEKRAAVLVLEHRLEQIRLGETDSPKVVQLNTRTVK